MHLRCSHRIKLWLDAMRAVPRAESCPLQMSLGRRQDLHLHRGWCLGNTGMAVLCFTRTASFSMGGRMHTRERDLSTNHRASNEIPGTGEILVTDMSDSFQEISSTKRGSDKHKTDRAQLNPWDSALLLISHICFWVETFVWLKFQALNYLQLHSWLHFEPSIYKTRGKQQNMSCLLQ